MLAARLGFVMVLVWVPWGIAQEGDVQPESPATGQSEGGPKLVAKERTVDLGRIKEGERATAKFQLENQGTENVVISDVRASCGCTVPRQLTEEEKILEPGETLTIEAQFNSKSRSGKQKKSVTITSNDPTEPRMQLYLSCDVVMLYELSVNGRPQARSVRIGSVRAGSEIPQTIEFLPSEPGRTLTLTDVTLMTPAMSYTSEPLVKDDRRGEAITLHVEDEAPIGQLQTSLRASMKVDEDVAQATVSISGEVIGELSFRPAEVKQWQASLPGKQLVPVTVTSQTRTPFEILKAEAGGYIETDVTPRHGKYDYQVTLRIKDDAPVGPFGTFLDIYTSSVEQPLVRIPVWGQVAPRVSAEPAVVLLRQDGSGKASSRRIKLETYDRAHRLKVLDVTTDLPYITAEAVDVEGLSRPSLQFVRVTGNEGAPLGKHVGHVLIKTSVEGQAEISVPVTLIVSDGQSRAAANRPG